MVYSCIYYDPFVSEERALRIPATFFRGGMDPDVHYRFSAAPKRWAGAGGQMEVSDEGLGWRPGRLSRVKAWLVPWNEIRSIETVRDLVQPIASNVRVHTDLGVVDLWVATIDVERLLMAVRGYLHPDE